MAEFGAIAVPFIRPSGNRGSDKWACSPLASFSVSYPERLKAVRVDMLLNTEAVIGTEGIEK